MCVGFTQITPFSILMLVSPSPQALRVLFSACSNVLMLEDEKGQRDIETLGSESQWNW